MRIHYDLSSCLFKVEGTGALPPQDMVLEAVRVLRNKLRIISAAIEACVTNAGAGGGRGID